MRTKADDESAIAFGAQAARIAGDSRDTLGGANHHPITGGCDEAVWTVLRDHSRNWQSSFRKLIGMCDGVRRKVYHESVAVSGADPPQICDGCRLMRIRETAPAEVSFGKLRQRHTIDLVTIAGKIPGLVVTPQLTGGKRADGRKKFSPLQTTKSGRNF